MFNLKYEHAISFINLVKFINYYQMARSIPSKLFVIASGGGEANVYGSSYYWNFRTSSFKQVACLILWICFYKRDCYVRSATQKYVISKRKLNLESMTHTKSANVVVTINTICSFMKKNLICPIHIWFNPQWSLKNTLVPMSGVQLLKFRGSQ